MSCDPRVCPTPQRHRGFSLVEIMVVLVIIGLLAGVVTLNVRQFLTAGKQNTARAEIATLVEAIEAFSTITGRYPTNEEGLQSLLTPTESLSQPLLKQDPIDPWGNPYQYNSPGERDAYEVVSLGADGREGGVGEDVDIVSWRLKPDRRAQ